MEVEEGPRYGPLAGGPARAVVVLAHGYGTDGHDLIDVAALWAEAVPEALFLAPHAPLPCEGLPMGRRWFPLWEQGQAQLRAGVEAAAAALGRFVRAHLTELGLTPRRAALMGFSQGAMTVLEAGLRGAVPEPACILAYSGGLIGAEGAAVPLLAKPPVLLVHGEADEVVPAAASRLTEAALRAAGVPVEALYPARLGHGLDEAGLMAGARLLAARLGGAAERVGKGR